MKYFLVFFLPVLIFSQQDNLSDGTGSYRQYFDENKTSRKHVLKMLFALDIIIKIMLTQLSMGKRFWLSSMLTVT